MKNKLLLLTVIFFQTHLLATEINSENIKSILESKNLKVEASKTEFLSAQERETSVALSFLPQIDIHGSQESFKTGTQSQKNQPTYGAEAKISIYNGGRDQMQSEIKTLQSQKKNYQLQRVLAEELEKARDLFWQILYLKEKVTLVSESIKVNDNNSKAADRRIRSGVATESDRYVFEMKSVELDQTFEEAQLSLETKKRYLAILLGFDDPKEMSFSQILDHDHEISNFLKHSPKDHEFLYKENELQSAQSALEAKTLQRTWWPKLEAFASYNQYNEREKEYAVENERTESAVGLRLSLSLASAIDSSYESRSLQQLSRSAGKLADLQKKEIEIHLENEIAELELLHNQVHKAEENIIRAKKYYTVTHTEYVRGTKSSTDILSSSEKLFDIQNKRIEIIRDFQIAKIHIQSKIGK